MEEEIIVLMLICEDEESGHGSYQKWFGNNCNLPMSQPSISRSLRYIAQLIVKVKSAEISFPNSAEEENVTKIGFLKRFGIKSVIGAIDCTHVAIIAPPSDNPKRPLNLYMNRKGFYSINVEAVCDHRLVFTFLNTKFPGATQDSGIWATSHLREHLIRRQESWLLGGQGYPLEPWLSLRLLNQPLNKKSNLIKCTLALEIVSSERLAHLRSDLDVCLNIECYTTPMKLQEISFHHVHHFI